MNTEATKEGKSAEAGKIVEFNEEAIKDHLSGMVLRTVEETLNALLDAEADGLCGAKRYEHQEGRQDTRGGHCERGPHTKAGEVKPKVPKLRNLPFETAIIERYLAGVSVRRIKDITEASAGRGSLPGWQQRAHVGIGPAAPYRGDRMGSQTPHGHGTAGGKNPPAQETKAAQSKQPKQTNNSGNPK